MHKSLPLIVLGALTLNCLPLSAKNQGYSNVATKNCKDYASTQSLHRAELLKYFDSTIKTNSSIKSARLAYDASRSDYNSKISTLFPELTLYSQPQGYTPDQVFTRTLAGKNTYQEGSTFTFSNTFPQYGLSLSVDIFNLPKYNIINASRNSMKSAYYSYQGTVRDALQSVASLYFRIQARVAVNDDAKETIKRFEGYTKTQRELLNKGFTTVIDYASQATALQEYQSRLYDSINQVSLLSNTLEAISGLQYDGIVIPLLPAECLPNIPATDKLEDLLVQNFEQLKVLDYQSYFLADQARASSNSILPTLGIGYEYSYYLSKGNISGYDVSGQEVYSESNAYPYLLLSMNISLGGGQFTTARKLRQQSKSTQELREQKLKDLSSSLRNDIVNIKTNKELNRSYSEIKSDLNNILDLTNIGLKAGFVDFSTFQANQQRYFNALINAQTALTNMYISYISLLRLTEDAQLFGLQPLLHPSTVE